MESIFPSSFDSGGDYIGTSDGSFDSYSRLHFDFFFGLIPC